MKSAENIATGNVRLVEISDDDLARYSEHLVATAHAMSAAIRCPSSDLALINASMAVFHALADVKVEIARRLGPNCCCRGLYPSLRNHASDECSD